MSADKKTNTKDHNDSESLRWGLWMRRRLEEAERNEQRRKIEGMITLIESRWEDVRIPNHNSIEQVEKRISYLREEIQKLREKRPDCAKLMGDYERNFQDYREHVRELIAHKRETIKILEDLAKEPSTDLETVENILHPPEYSRLIIYEWWIKKKTVVTKRQFSRLIILRQDLQRQVRAHRNSNIKDQLKGSEELTNELQSYGNILNQLEERTHQWKDTAWQTIPLPPYSKPDPTRVAKVVTERECTKCGKKEIVAGTLK